MTLRELYKEEIGRPVNPAVSATKLDEETTKVEIREYVFTDEIINGLYRVLNAIKNNQLFSHVGIWIDGYYGSGKSHFLKYLDYCIMPDTRDDALNRFIEAVEEIDPLDDKHNLEFGKEELKDIAKWLKKATVETCIFNLETSYDQSTDKKDAFLQVFWSEFNKLRGFNEFNISLAQNLEKPLSEKGVFEEFKKRIAEEGGDWSVDAADLIDNELQWVLDIAKDLAPTLDTESIRERILRRDTAMSIKNFAKELNQFLDGKDENYRLILLVDEVSQFINKQRDRYLNLQEIITHLSEACGNRVWIACTAQQDLSEVIDDCNVSEGVANMGKILGRFEVKVSLKGTQPEFITQKRILEKSEVAKGPLKKLFDKEQNGFTQRFALPESYKGFTTRDQFVDFYPFVPYQFKLIMQVFNNFLNLGYVAKEVKGNERSIIKVVHSTAKANADEELGKLISFDQLYDNMFETGLQARGQKAVENAAKMAREYKPNTKLAQRVVNVLFMICNISETDKLIFPATLQNVTTLLLQDFTTPFLTIKEDVRQVIEFLCEKNVIREEKPKKGLDPFYSFYSEEEMKVAELIKHQAVDTTYQADQLWNIINKNFTTIRNKEQYKTRSISIGGLILQRTKLTNNPEVMVEFCMDSDTSVEDMIMRNQGNRLVFLVGKLFHADSKLANDFSWYCKVQKYTNENNASGEENAKVREEFEKRAAETLTTTIIPRLKAILDTCPVMAGQTEIEEAYLSGKTGTDRYNAAMQYLLGQIYPRAAMVDNPKIPHDTAALRTAILRNVQPGDYEGLDAALPQPEQEVEIYLAKQGSLDVNVASITSKFAQPPYGWHEVCTLYVINELVRRHRRDYSYLNNPNVEAQTVAGKLVTDTNKFTLRQGEAIPQEVVNKFIEAWKKVFTLKYSFSTTDSTQLYRSAQEMLEKLTTNYNEELRKYGSYGFSEPLSKAVELFGTWSKVKDHSRFFNTIINGADDASKLMDECRAVLEFIHEQMDNFNKVKAFADSNRDNFEFLPAEFGEIVEDIKALPTTPWPFRIRDYLKKVNEVEKALDGVRKTIREEIKQEYVKTYELLCNSAKAEGIDASIVADPAAIYGNKCLSGNILVLRSNVDANEYFAREAEKIQREKVRRVTPPTPPDNPGDDPTTPKPDPKPYATTCTMKLNTLVVGLDNEAAVDAYLANLKKQIMAKINDNKIVNIIK